MTLIRFVSVVSVLAAGSACCTFSGGGGGLPPTCAPSCDPADCIFASGATAETPPATAAVRVEVPVADAQTTSARF